MLHLRVNKYENLFIKNIIEKRPEQADIYTWDKSGKTKRQIQVKDGEQAWKTT